MPEALAGVSKSEASLMDGLTLAAVIIVGVIVLAVASMIFAIGKEQADAGAALERLEIMLAELPAKLATPPVEQPLEAVQRIEAPTWPDYRTVSKEGRERLQA